MESDESKIGKKDKRKVLGSLNKALFALDAKKRVCSAKDPEGCDAFLFEPTCEDCHICWMSIHLTTGKEVGGTAFLVRCKYTYKDFDYNRLCYMVRHYMWFLT